MHSLQRFATTLFNSFRFHEFKVLGKRIFIKRMETKLKLIRKKSKKSTTKIMQNLHLNAVKYNRINKNNPHLKVKLTTITGEAEGRWILIFQIKKNKYKTEPQNKLTNWMAIK